ncbi:TonB-dependent receptor [candidate division KSB1 bacterium]|nr:TonB-dependent receptor [candidate division KSB1 bacterium]
MLIFRYIYSLFFILVIPAVPFAQRHEWQHRHQHFEQHLHKHNCGIIFGKVTADSTHEELPGVNMTIHGTNLGAATGPDGNYMIRGVPVGSYMLRATMMGYEISEQPIVVRAGAEISADFCLTESVIEMNEIVVTGTGMPTLYQDSPVKTAVVRRDMIEKQKANNLAEAIDFQTGVRVESNCQNCNFAQVRLLGLEGHHSQILIDSNPVISSLAGVYGLEQLPSEMIERVEIVKGGGSSLYGGQALAGVVNLITRRPSHNDFSLDYSNGSIADTYDHRIGGTISRVNNAGTSKGILFGNIRHRDPYDHNGDGFSEIGQIKQEAAGANWYFIHTDRGELSVQLLYIHEDRRGGNKFDLAPHQADIAEWTETHRYGGSMAWNQRITPLLDFKAFASFALTNRNSYYGAEKDENAYGKTENPLSVSGIRMNYLAGRHSIITGVEFKQDGINDEAIAYDRIINETYNNLGLILQDTYTIDKNETTELVYGARIDKHSAINSMIVSPRVAMKSELSRSVVFRGGYSSGFKAPQVFDEDLHITQVAGKGHIIRNSKDLQEEHGHTFYGGLEYQGIIDIAGLKIGVNGFYTKIKDTFLLTEMDDPATDETEFYRINGSGMQVQGVEAELGLRFGNAELLTGITIQSSLLDEPEPDFGSKKIFRTPDAYGSLRLSWDVTERLNLMFTTKYTGSMVVPHYAGYIQEDRLEQTKEFLTFDVIASYKIPLSRNFFGTLAAGVYNITDDYQNDFDLGINRDAGYVYGPLVPRRMLLGFSIGHNH